MSDTSCNLTSHCKTFTFVRDVDESGVSGTGVVAEGIEFSNGKVAVCFLSDKVKSAIVYDSIEDAVAIHGHGGKTRLVYTEQIIMQGESTYQKIGKWFARKLKSTNTNSKIKFAPSV